MAKKRLHIHAESADNGGWSVKSHASGGDMGSPMPQDQSSATFGDYPAAHAHMGKLMAKHAGAKASVTDAADKQHPAYGAFGRGR